MTPFDWPDPDLVGQSEYRAIHDCVADALEDVPEGEQRDVALSMLDEFESWARSLRQRLTRDAKAGGDVRG